MYTEIRKGIQRLQFLDVNAVRKAISFILFESLCEAYVQKRGDIPRGEC
jgi:hypothetical protein